MLVKVCFESAASVLRKYQYPLLPAIWETQHVILVLKLFLLSIFIFWYYFLCTPNTLPFLQVSRFAWYLQCSLWAHDIPSLSHNWKSHVYFMSYWTSHILPKILSSFLLLWVSSEMEYLESLPGFEHLAALLSCVPHSMCFQHVLIHKVGFITTVFFF